METINWNATKEEVKVIHDIAKRAQYLEPRVKLMDLEMDITAVHLNGCKLKLSELLKADDFNFAHDVFGISRHISRIDGSLKDCFLPRYAA